MSSENFSPQIAQLFINLTKYHDLFRLWCGYTLRMIKNFKMQRLTFTITPNANGYLVGCNEVPSLFTDVSSVINMNRVIKDMISEYTDMFPEDSQKRGIEKDMPIEIIWKASPNSVALE